jgi:hypothetical protein
MLVPSDSYKPDNFELPTIKHPLKMSMAKNIITKVKNEIFFTKTSFGLSVNAYYTYVYYPFFQIFVNTFLKKSKNLRKNVKIIAHNVPAVYDVLAARISKCVAFAGPTKCGWRLAWEWSVAE